VQPERQKKRGQTAQALGRSRGGFSTKIHMSVDGLGNPLRLRLTRGERHDITQAIPLIDGYTCAYVLADRGYDADAFIEFILSHHAIPVIPPKANRTLPRDFDPWRYHERQLVECFMNKIKHFRRVFSRFDKLAKRYLGFLSFVSSLIWLR
jgi:transposase